MVTIKLVRALRYGTLTALYLAGKNYTVSAPLAETLLASKDDKGMAYFKEVTSPNVTAAKTKKAKASSKGVKKVTATPKAEKSKPQKEGEVTVTV